MIRVFNTKDKAVSFAEEKSLEHKVTTYLAQWTDKWVVFTMAHYPQGIINGRCTHHEYVNGWRYCKPSGIIRDDIHIVEYGGLPDGVERKVDEITKICVGFSTANMIDIATNIINNNTCIWHELAVFTNTLDTCPCAKCDKERVAV